MKIYLDDIYNSFKLKWFSNWHEFSDAILAVSGNAKTKTCWTNFFEELQKIYSKENKNFKDEEDFELDLIKKITTFLEKNITHCQAPKIKTIDFVKERDAKKRQEMKREVLEINNEYLTIIRQTPMVKKGQIKKAKQIKQMSKIDIAIFFPYRSFVILMEIKYGKNKVKNLSVFETTDKSYEELNLPKRGKRLYIATNFDGETKNTDENRLSYAIEYNLPSQIRQKNLEDRMSN